MPTTVYAALHGFLGILIPLANIVVIFTVYKLMKKKQYKGYILIINLATADVLVGLMCIVEAIDDVYDGDFDKDITFCLLRICLTITPCIGSILTLMLISLDRYLAVKLPLQYRRIVNTKTLFSVLIALWSFSFVVGHLPLIVPTLQQSNYAGFCGLLYSTKNEYLYVICVAVFIPVFLTLICLHVNLGRMACKQHRQIQRTRVGAVSPLRLRRFKAARTVLIVTICFAWSWGPYYITGIIQATCSDYDLKDLLKDFLFFLGETNSLMNPLIYAFYSKDIRSYLCKLCRG